MSSHHVHIIYCKIIQNCRGFQLLTGSFCNTMILRIYLINELIFYHIICSRCKLVGEGDPWNPTKLIHHQLTLLIPIGWLSLYHNTLPIEFHILTPHSCLTLYWRRRLGLVVLDLAAAILDPGTRGVVISCDKREHYFLWLKQVLRHVLHHSLTLIAWLFSIFSMCWNNPLQSIKCSICTANQYPSKCSS